MPAVITLIIIQTGLECYPALLGGMKKLAAFWCFLYHLISHCPRLTVKPFLQNCVVEMHTKAPLSLTQANKKRGKRLSYQQCLHDEQAKGNCLMHQIYILLTDTACPWNGASISMLSHNEKRHVFSHADPFASALFEPGCFSSAFFGIGEVICHTFYEILCRNNEAYGKRRSQ